MAVVMPDQNLKAGTGLYFEEVFLAIRQMGRALHSANCTQHLTIFPVVMTTLGHIVPSRPRF
jgi:hypothetical protein